MTFNEYQKLSARTINNALSDDEKTQHSVLGMASEVGEVAGLYQKVFQGHELDKNHVLSEIGDLLWFISEWCNANSVNFDEIAEYNVSKLRKRFPDGFSEEKSLHRADGDI